MVPALPPLFCSSCHLQYLKLISDRTHQVVTVSLHCFVGEEGMGCICLGLPRTQVQLAAQARSDRLGLCASHCYTVRTRIHTYTYGDLQASG